MELLGTELERMMVTGGFGMTMDLERGTMRQWVMGRDGVKRWADNNARCDALDLALAEGLEILDNLIANIQAHGHYSVDSTIVFLSQARQCFKALEQLVPNASGKPTTEAAKPL